MRYFSPSTGGFYSEAIHGARQLAEPQTERQKKAGKRPVMTENPDCRIPADAVPIDPVRYQQLFDAQAQGMEIVVRGGKPVAVERSPSAEELAAGRRRDRDRKLAASDWTQLADALLDQPERKTAWASYRQALRDLDMSGTDWPALPGDSQSGEA